MFAAAFLLTLPILSNQNRSNPEPKLSPARQHDQVRTSQECVTALIFFTLSFLLLLERIVSRKPKGPSPGDSAHPLGEADI